MTPRLWGENCKLFTTPLFRNYQKRIEHKKNKQKYRKMTRKPRTYVRILIYRTWVIVLFRLLRLNCISGRIEVTLSVVIYDMM